ncbi:hypothetical protein [Cerasicoccus fimbriatus]|uniref:hypothetical protein n=1 Tax=Cerasicoccus fimbriatus TaxID=3014554 RepID=UPI0022B45103|nr:hypothetical protein [Cerasicoccus sp. TK19100]
MKKNLLQSFQQKLDAMRQLMPEPPAAIQELEQSIKHPVATLKRQLAKQFELEQEDSPDHGKTMGR